MSTEGLETAGSHRQWGNPRLADVCEIEKVRPTEDGLPYVGLENIEPGTGRLTGRPSPRKAKSATFSFRPDHVLYGRLRPYLNKALAPTFSGHCSTEIFPIKPKAVLSRRFLLYWLLQDSTVAKINSTCTGARMPRANMNAVIDLRIPLPPIREQERIVLILDEIFSGIDAAVANSAAIEARVQELFESHLDLVFREAGNRRIRKPLSEFMSITHGFAFKGSHFEISDHKERPIVLTPGNYTENGRLQFTSDNTKRLKVRFAPPPDYTFAVGDLTVVMTDLSSKMKILGKPAFVDRPNVLHNQRIGRAVFTAGGLQPKYVYYFLRTREVAEEIKKTSTGTMVRHTAPKRILANRIPVPEDQCDQVRFIAELDRLAEFVDQASILYQQKLCRLTELKKSILRKAFTGELTAQEADKQVSSVA